MTRSSGSGTASLAASWASAYGLEDVRVWADTSDYMYFNFAATLGGAYPHTLVIDIDTMELRYFQLGDVSSARSAINAILSAPHPCAE